MKLYFVRHGESEANLLNEFSNGLNKHGLTGKGRQQADMLARSLRGAGISRIYTSPILRALQTAEILAGDLGLAYTVTEALREYDVGVLEGRSDAASWELFWQVSESWMARGEWDERLEGGESFNDIRRRFVPFVEALVQQLQPASSGGIVLVGHGGTYRCMLPLVLGNIDFRFAREHAIANTAAIVAVPGPYGLVCTDWGDIHLGDGSG
jgi:broad specificity phosphatase PhoE